MEINRRFPTSASDLIRLGKFGGSSVSGSIHRRSRRACCESLLTSSLNSSMMPSRNSLRLMTGRQPLEKLAMDLRRVTGERFAVQIVAFVSLLIVGRADAEPLYTVTNFGSAIPMGINSAGDVLLTSGTNGPYNGVYHSYGASAGQITPLTAYGLPPTPAVPYQNEPQPSATGLTDLGTIVGGIPVGNTEHAFLSSGGQVTDLGLLRGYGATQATAANSSGVVIGQAYDHGSSLNPASAAFIYQNGQMTNIGTLGGSNTLATAINSSGEVVGNSNDHAFVYQNGHMTDLGTFGDRKHRQCHQRSRSNCWKLCLRIQRRGCISRSRLSLQQRNDDGSRHTSW